ncbi:MAG: heavy metal-associated domain-containing protein [Anaerocolumna sp.]
MNKAHYNVSGLINGQIKTQVKNVLHDIEGINTIDVDLVNGSIEIGYNDSVDTKKIIQGIERVGCKIEGQRVF